MDPSQFAPSKITSLLSNPIDNRKTTDTIQNFPLMLNAIDTQGRVRIWNKQCEQVTGYKAAELIGKPNSFFTFLYPDFQYRSEIVSQWAKCNYEFSNWDTFITCKDGKNKKVSWSSMPNKKFVPGLENWLFGEELCCPEYELGSGIGVKDSEPLQEDDKSYFLDQNFIGHRKHLEMVNQELINTNKVLSKLIEQIEKEKEAVEKKFERAVHEHILPTLEQLNRDIEKTGCRINFQAAISQIKDYLPFFSGESNILLSLSSTENRIAKLITNGFTSQEIADKLYISLDTVKTHRRNIRKKMGINNKNINLVTYIRSILAQT